MYMERGRYERKIIWKRYDMINMISDMNFSVIYKDNAILLYVFWIEGKVVSF